MRFFSYLAFISVFIAAVPAYADILPDFPGKHIAKYIWGPPNANFTRPYTERSKVPQNSRWDDDEWSPQDWIDDRGNDSAVLEGFYRAEIITDQFTENGVPVLEVGYNFMSLSGKDKNRVLEFVDYAYGITDGEHGMFRIEEERCGTRVGIYTRAGLQIQ